MTLDPILTVPEVAADLRISRAHVYKVIKGEVPGVSVLPAIVIGRRRLVRRSLEQWKQGNEHAALDATMDAEYADIRQRVYRGDIDSPKSVHSVRWAALSDGLLQAIREWRELSLDPRPDTWVFPSEKGTTPLLKDNCWRRHFAPQLNEAGLGWVNFHVMRRTHSSLMQ